MQALWVRTIRGIEYGHACSMIVCMDSGGKRKGWNDWARGSGFGRHSSGFPFRIVEAEVRMGHPSDSMCVCVLVAQSCLTLCNPMDYSPPGSSVQNSLGKNTGVGCHFLIQRVFPTQGSNLCLLHCRQILYWVIREPLLRYMNVQKFLKGCFSI